MTEWPAPPPRNLIQVWLCLGVAHSDFDGALGRLSLTEQERALQYRFDTDRRRFIGCRLFVSSILAHYLDRPRCEIAFVVAKGGKPALHPAMRSTLHFNLSRSHDLTLLGVAQDREIGIDVERRVDHRKDRDIARRYFSEDEQEYIRCARDPTAAFFEIWARKEAYIKALGRGLAHPLDAFDVTPRAPDSEVRDWSDKPSSTEWAVRNLSLPTEGYAAALAGPHPLPAHETFVVTGAELLRACEQDQ